MSGNFTPSGKEVMAAQQLTEQLAIAQIQRSGQLEGICRQASRPAWMDPYCPAPIPPPPSSDAANGPVPSEGLPPNFNESDRSRETGLTGDGRLALIDVRSGDRATQELREGFFEVVFITPLGQTRTRFLAHQALFADELALVGDLPVPADGNGKMAEGDGKMSEDTETDVPPVSEAMNQDSVASQVAAALGQFFDRPLQKDAPDDTMMDEAPGKNVAEGADDGSNTLLLIGGAALVLGLVVFGMRGGATPVGPPAMV